MITFPFSKMVIFCCYDRGCAFKSQLCKKELRNSSRLTYRDFLQQRGLEVAGAACAWGGSRMETAWPSPNPCPPPIPAQTLESSGRSPYGYGGPVWSEHMTSCVCKIWKNFCLQETCHRYGREIKVWCLMSEHLGISRLRSAISCVIQASL